MEESLDPNDSPKKTFVLLDSVWTPLELRKKMIPTKRVDVRLELANNILDYLLKLHSILLSVVSHAVSAEASACCWERSLVLCFGRRTVFLRHAIPLLTPFVVGSF
ncbi:hypothetical protein GOODEAATRI_032554 [Goodea atripinnis]|uniref:Uncharacterized protein n=1 Tax=Goodea atripinnis TaxID=208336 RepID=A0ABV0MMI9_9TELE